MKIKVKQEKGFVGIDITVALIILLLFISILAVLFYNIKIANKASERQYKATNIATSIIEVLKSKQYANVLIATQKSNAEVKKVNSTYQYTSSNGGTPVVLDGITIEDGYTAYVYVENFVPEIYKNGNEQDLVKVITVQVEYKIANEIKTVRLSTSIVKN